MPPVPRPFAFLAPILCLLTQGGAALAQEGAREAAQEAGGSILRAAIVMENETGAAVAPQPGDTLILRLRVVNQGETAVTLRHVTLDIPAPLTLLDPFSDRIDNDRDGEVDELDEIAELGDETLQWTGLRTVMAPRGHLEFWARARVAVTGEGPLMARAEVSGEAEEGGALRAASRTALPLAALRLTLERRTPPDPAIILYHDDRLVTEVHLTLPEGGDGDWPVRISVLPPPAAGRLVSIRGTAATCPDAGEPAFGDDAVVWELGACSAGESILVMEHRTQDADPDAAPGAIRAHRSAQITAQATRGDTTVAARSPLLMAGPLLSLTREGGDPPPRFDAGDTLSAQYRLVNTGDGRASRVTVTAPAGTALSCDSIRLAVDETVVAGCDAILETALDPGDAVRVTLTGTTVEGVGLDRPLALVPRLSAKAEIGLPPRIAQSPLRALPRPALPPAIAADGAVTAAPGAEATLALTLFPPEGTVEAAAAIRARVASGGTGEPVGPAALALSSIAMSGHDDAGLLEGTVSRVEDGWQVIEIPLGQLRVSGASAGATRHPVEVAIKVRVTDSPLLRAGRVLQIQGLSAIGGHVDTTETLIEAPVEEPRLTLLLRTDDRDRLVRPSDTVTLTARGCNIGDATAHGVILSLTAGPHLNFIEPVAVSVIGEGDERRIEAEVLPLEIRASEDAAGGALSSGECLAIKASARVGTDPPPDSDLTARAVFAPYRSLAIEGGRVYQPPEPVAIALRAPALRLSMVAAEETMAIPGQEVVKSFAVEAPDRGGPYRLSIRAASSADLDWRLLQRGDDGQLTPWVDGTEAQAGEIMLLVLKTRAPDSLPSGWVDTTVLRAAAVAPAGETREAALRWIVRGKPRARGGRVAARKTMALDRDCDGSAADEALQDGIFEPYKEALEGECIVFRIEFENIGEKSMEKVVIGDIPPEGTRYLPGSARVADVPDDLFPDPPEAWPREDGGLSWTFRGMLEAADGGAVEYGVRVSAP